MSSVTLLTVDLWVRDELEEDGTQRRTPFVHEDLFSCGCFSAIESELVV